MTLNLATVPFTAAADFFRQKVNVPTKTWTDIYGAQHSRSFVVAGAMQSSLLGDIHTALQKAVDTGTTMEEFRRDFDVAVEKHGWSYNGGRNWRTAVIYNTNLRSAYHAGRYAQQMDPDVLKEFPNLRYIHGASLVPRPEHLAWNGVTLPATDPWWTTHYGQNGWGCKCRVESAPATAAVKQPEDFGTREWTNPSTGAVRNIPVGIDPGFDHNPGMARGNDDLATLALEKSAAWEDITPPSFIKDGRKVSAAEYYDRPAIVPADKPKAHLGDAIHDRHAPDTARLLEGLFINAIGAPEKVFMNPLGNGVVVNRKIVDHMLEKPERIDGREQLFPLIPDVIESPFEIWMGWARNTATGKVAPRARYVKVLNMGKDVVIGLVADIVDGMWTGTTYFRGKHSALDNLRKGNLIWGRK